VTAWSSLTAASSSADVKFTVPEDVPLGPLAAVLMVVREQPTAAHAQPEPRRTMCSLVAWLNNPVRNDCLLVELVQSTRAPSSAGASCRTA